MARNNASVVAVGSERPRLTELDELFERDPDDSLRVVASRGGEFELPMSAARLLRRLVKLLAAGHAVTVEPLERALTMQQAADILNVSRPYLDRLLDQDEIPWTRTGRRRRVRLEDVLAYKRRRDAERRAALRELTRLSDELGLYGRPPAAKAGR